MESLILHKGNRGHIADIARCETSMTIGRGFDNDVVLSDPYVAARQALVEAVDGRWMLKVLDHTNPVLINGELVDDSAILHSGDKLTLGRTRLSVFNANQVPDKTRKLHVSGWLQRSARSQLSPYIVLLIACLLAAVEVYFEQLKGMDWKATGLTVSILVAVILVWSSLWALVGRVVTHHGHFNAQLLATSIIVGLTILLSPLIDYSGYASNSEFIGQSVDITINFFSFLLLLNFNLFFATNLTNNTSIAAVLALALVSVSYGLHELNQQEFSSEPEYMQSLKPPFARMRNDLNVDQFLDRAQERWSELGS